MSSRFVSRAFFFRPLSVRALSWAVGFAFLGLLMISLAETAMGQAQPAAMAIRTQVARDGIAGQGGAAPATGAPAANVNPEDPTAEPDEEAPAVVAPPAASKPSAKPSAKPKTPPVELKTIDNPQFIYKLHEKPVTSLMIDPSGFLCLSGSIDQTAHVWRIREVTAARENAAAGQPANPWGQQRKQDDANDVISPLGKRITVLAEGHRQGITGVTADPTGEYAYTSSYDQTVRRWDLHSGEPKKKYSGAKDRLWAIALSPDSDVVAGAGNNGAVYFWKVATGRLIGQPEVHKGPVFDVQPSPDGLSFVSAGADGTAKIITSDMKVKTTFEGHLDKVYSAVFSADGKLVLTASKDKSARLWDAQTGAELCRFVGHGGAVRRAIFLPTRNIATAGDDQTVRIWTIPPEINVGKTAATSREAGVMGQGFVGGGFSGDFISEEPAEEDNTAIADEVFGENSTPATGQKQEKARPKVRLPRGQEIFRFITPAPVFSLAGNESVLLAGCQNGNILLWDLTGLLSEKNSGDLGRPGMNQGMNQGMNPGVGNMDD